MPSHNPGVYYPAGTSGALTPVPSSRRLIKGKRAAAEVVASHDAVKELMREIKRRSGLTEAAIAGRMGICRQGVDQVTNDFLTMSTRRRVSLVWAARYAAVCGARLIVEFPVEA